MCDASQYYRPVREAGERETLILKVAPNGSAAAFDLANQETMVCLRHGYEVLLQGVPEETQRCCGVGPEVRAVVVENQHRGYQRADEFKLEGQRALDFRMFVGCLVLYGEAIPTTDDLFDRDAEEAATASESPEARRGLRTRAKAASAAAVVAITLFIGKLFMN